MPTWRDLSKIFGLMLLFSIIAFNLLRGGEILTSIFRGIVVYLAYSIIIILVTNAVYKMVSDYEYKRMKELSEMEDEEETEEEEEEEEFTDEESAGEDEAKEASG